MALTMWDNESVCAKLKLILRHALTFKGKLFKKKEQNEMFLSKDQ